MRDYAFRARFKPILRGRPIKARYAGLTPVPGFRLNGPFDGGVDVRVVEDEGAYFPWEISFKLQIAVYLSW
ncbi:hypothetical protein RGR602_PB00429 (plasmid) [Rhizobium gallicum bv. gallicum R602sp]|uniref:Uncharacterized protein n=1 Tax=Rhizobium gallicum bv. gallicum R602sp TaxID=1041138 RepID=A0A0B4X7J1_9HYPH|nr:hypothetical protein RGR602_PB00429 [Rhizobium gallicum bv. gallicum R602sp]